MPASRPSIRPAARPLVPGTVLAATLALAAAGAAVERVAAQTATPPTVRRLDARRYEIVLPTPGGGTTPRSRDVIPVTLPLLAWQLPTVTVGQTAVNGFRHVELAWLHPSNTVTQSAAIDFDLSGFSPTFHWLPHLTPLPGSVVGQHVFRSPAIVVGDAERFVAIVPDLDAVDQPGAPWYLDLDAQAQTAHFGMAQQDVPVHVLFRSQPQVEVGGRVRLSFWVSTWASDDAVPDPFGPVSKFLWGRYARPRLDRIESRTTPFVDFVKTAYHWLLDDWVDALWMDFTVGGSPVSGTQWIVDHTFSPQWPGLPNPIPIREIWNQAWFSNLRTATGMARWGRRLDVDDWRARAERMKDLALAAPRSNGLFPSVLQLQQNPTTGAWVPLRWTGSDRSPSNRGVTRDWYHVLDMSWTTLHLLRWYVEIDHDPAVRAAVRSYVARLLTLQRPDGHFPAWLDPVTQAPDRTLEDSPETALSAVLLFEYVEAGLGGRAELQAALDAVEATLEPAFAGRWEDFETYWSDNSIGSLTHVGRRFARNNMHKQNNLAMDYVADALLHAYRATGDTRYARLGRRMLDELSMTQQVWEPPTMYVSTVGGFGVMNADGEWNDARQALFAERYMQYYAELGDPELFERGVAALRASFVMMHHPALPRTRALWRRRFPTLTDADHGYMAENYGHFGFTSAAGDGLTAFTIFDWGAGGASEAAARVLDHWGSVHVDPARGHAFGIDAVEVERVRGGWRVRDLAGRARWIEVSYPGREKERVWLDGVVVL